MTKHETLAPIARRMSARHGVMVAAKRLPLLAGAALLGMAALPADPAGAWRLHARAVANNGGSPAVCDKKAVHIGCSRKTRECFAADNPTSAWAHASYHKKCKRHLDAWATPGASAHAHHGPHSPGPCLRDSIEDRYHLDPVDTLAASPAAPEDEDEPATFDFALKLPPPKDAAGTLAYASLDADAGAERGTKLAFAPGSRIQVSARDIGPSRAAMAAIRACVATEDGKRLQDGLIELVVDEEGRHLNAGGLFKEMRLEVKRHETLPDVWVVDLGGVAMALDWLPFRSDIEVLLENAALER